jgi:hypothetical protein
MAKGPFDMHRSFVVAATAAAVAFGTNAQANFTISNAATQNVSCSNGLCEPTAENPVLNAGDLEALLAAGSVEIETHANHVNAGNIVVRAALAWSAATTLRLDEHLVVDKAISINGSGTVTTRQPGFSFGPKGKIQCADLSCNVNGYTPVNTLPGLAAAIAANPQGKFALVRSYNASADGTYTSSPVATNFLGTLEGLGNTVSNISVNNTTGCCVGGLFQSLSLAYVYDLHLGKVTVMSTGGAAGFAYESFAYVDNVSVTGSVSASGSGDVGGLVADNYAEIRQSYSTAAASSASTVNGVDVGGLVGADFGDIEASFATGNVSAGNGSGNLGGLVGETADGGGVVNSYATGAASGGAGLIVGGLIGKNSHAENGGGIFASYCVGAVSGGSGSIVGGFMGENDNRYGTGYDYWDTTTSGTDVGVGLGNASGITGMTTEQLQSGLPPGFDKHWQESADINNGFPYLKSNPPPK